MSHFVSNPSHQNYYFKDSIAYTEDHIPVQKLYFYRVPPGLRQADLRKHFGIYGTVLHMQIYEPRGRGGRGGRKPKPTQLTGHVLYAEEQAAAKALHSRIHHLKGHKFHVQASDSWHQPEAYGPAMPTPNEETSPPPAIMSLNDHCLEHVLQGLTLSDQIHFARTCLRFRAVYQMATARLHKEVNLAQLDGMTVWDMRDFFKLSGCHVQKVEGMMPTIHEQRLCDFLAINCSNIQTMELFNCPMSSRSMHKIFGNKPQLETLHLIKSNISDGDIWALRNLRSLKTLNLEGNPLEGKYLSKLPSTIESLSLNSCTFFEGHHLSKICSSFPRLKELSILNINMSCVKIYETIVQDKSCEQLESLSISIDEGVKYEFVAQLPSLKRLFVFTTTPVRDTFRAELFEQLAQHKAEQLEQLEIFGHVPLTREMVLYVAKLVALRTLTVSRMQTDNLLDELCSLSMLEKFTLRHSMNVPDTLILRFFEACRYLSYVALEDFIAPTEKIVLGIVSKVRQEMANMEMKRKLPIQLWIPCLDSCLEKLVMEHPEKVPQDIIKIKCTSSLEYDLNTDFANLIEDDEEFDSDDLDIFDESDDDDSEYLSDHDLYDFFLSEEELDSDIGLDPDYG
ncbi:uncharacterized protein LOC108036204 [Drosophila biarmipes]|uniref:uncharacterized protein LOC108036204 n=1 Tax=Drosophila biarmipes TaxID=125945 RepID=UPI0007E6121C|nr:uncharacterized protein LOC108036204 [Drosophila biarmipes]